jgi:nucleoside-diphosphate-sugar epimerase
LVTEIASVINTKPKLWKVNSSLIKLIAKIGDQLKLPLNTERLNKLTESYRVSNHKIKTALGKEFPVSAKEGLRITLESFKN